MMLGFLAPPFGELPSNVRQAVDDFAEAETELEKQRMFNNLCQISTSYVVQLGDSTEYDRECERYARKCIKKVTGFNIKMNFRQI